MQIRAENMSLGYGDALVVDAMNLHLTKGMIVSIIGPNGSGKSTVLKGLTRHLNCKVGNVYFNQRDVRSFGNKELARKISVLPQIHHAPPDFKVKDLIAFGRMPYQKWYEKPSEEDERIVEWAMQVTGTSALRDKSITCCSGGEAQRVWIATALAQKPDILFLDEPTTYLDISHQIETMQLVKKLNQEQNIGIVMVLHDLGHAMETSDWIIVMKDGSKFAEGPPLEVITPVMMRAVYGVDCDIVNVPGRERPLIAYREIG